MGSFCAVRAHLYHDLYHYKRRVCMVLARRLRAAMATTPNLDDAVAAVLDDQDLVNGLRQGLTTLCSAAQGLQLRQGTRFEGCEAERDAIAEAARQMQEGTWEDWRVGDRALMEGQRGEERCDVACAATQTCEEMHRHAIAVLSAQL